MNHWVWYGIIVVLSYPFVVGFLFATSAFIYTRLYPRNGHLLFTRRQSYLYCFFLFAFFIVLLFISVRGSISDKVGLVFKPSILQIVLILLSPLLGVALYYMERCFSLFIQRYLGNLPFLILNTPLADSAGRFPNLKILVVLSVLISFCEEFIWRGYLITTLKDSVGLGLGNALTISSILFGINHCYFGLQAILIKSLSGMVLGMTYLLSGNIWAPFLAHTAFNINVWRKVSDGQIFEGRI